MAAPVVKGLLITASVLVAAGIAFYENEQVREWFNESRRKLAIALYSLGDEINPPSNSRRNSEAEDGEAQEDSHRRRRQEIIRLNRLELIKRARDEGVAVDLDQLAAIGRAYDEQTESLRARANTSRSFDDIVDSDGKLRDADVMKSATATSTGTALGEGGGGVRLRAGAGSRGLETGSRFANPFDDEMDCSYDQDQTRRENSRTLSPAPLIDVSDDQSEYFSEEELGAQIEEAIRRSLGDVDLSSSPSTVHVEDPPISVPAPEESFYYAPPPNVGQPPLSSNSLYDSAARSLLDEPLHVEKEDGAHTPAGTLTPTDDGFSTIASMASDGDDIGQMSELASIAGDAMRDDQASEAGYTSEYSMVDASTPGSWTDVESEAGEEEGYSTQILPNPASPF